MFKFYSIFITLLLLFSCGGKKAPEKKVERKVVKISSSNYPLENIKIIKENFQMGVKTNKVKADVLRKILIGEWDNGLHTTVRFDKESYSVFDWERSGKPYFTGGGGLYIVKDNTIVAVDDPTDTDSMIDYKISFIRYNQTYCDNDYCRYSLLIELEDNKNIKPEIADNYTYVMEDIGHISIDWYEYYNVKRRIDRK